MSPLKTILVSALGILGSIVYAAVLFIGLLNFTGLHVPYVSPLFPLCCDNQSEGAVATSADLRRSARTLDDRADVFGMNCLSTELKNVRACEQIIARAKRNPELARAMRCARKQDVTIFARKEFSINEHYVVIDSGASDEEIIRFLTGASPERQAKLD